MEASLGGILHSTNSFAVSTGLALTQTDRHARPFFRVIVLKEATVRISTQRPHPTISLPHFLQRSWLSVLTWHLSCSLICKHWLRGLCKKGATCEFLHEFNLRRMPECNYFSRHGNCSNGDDCLFLHISASSKRPACPHYDRGFCPLGPTCANKHIRRPPPCPYYLAGFCPDGRDCVKGFHPQYRDNLEKPQSTAMRERDQDGHLIDAEKFINREADFDAEMNGKHNTQGQVGQKLRGSWQRKRRTGTRNRWTLFTSIGQFAVNQYLATRFSLVRLGPFWYIWTLWS